MSIARGYNTAHGFDDGATLLFCGPAQAQGFAQYPGFFPQAFGNPFGQPFPQQSVPSFGWPGVRQTPMQPQNYTSQGQFGTGMSPWGQYPAYGQTWPAAPPATDHGFPGINLRNHTGGVGLPPGYDFLYPKENCIIHVFKTKEKPWQTTLWKHDNSTHIKLFVPVGTSIKELMQNLGCTNEIAEKNILYECCEKGNGQWAVGLKITGDNKDRVKKSIGDFGWTAKRTGFPGEQPVVWLWVTKDGQ
jgi:hypothetical protein